MSLLKVENHIFQLADCEMEDLSTCFADGERKVDFVLVHQTRSNWEIVSQPFLVKLGFWLLDFLSFLEA